MHMDVAQPPATAIGAWCGRDSLKRACMCMCLSMSMPFYGHA